MMMVMAQVSAIYFYLEPDQKRCFRDEVVKNFVSFSTFNNYVQTLEMTINILDENVVRNYKDNLKKSVDGIKLEVFSDDNGLK